MDTKVAESDLEATQQSLLVRLKDWDDQASWYDFFNKYWRLIYTVARRAGLSDVESQDVVQETVLSVARSIKSYQYQPEKCPFRSWLLMIARHRILNHLRKEGNRPERRIMDSEEESMPMPLENLSDPDGVPLEAIWNEEWNKTLIAAATEQVRKQVHPRQFQIYDLHVLQEWPANRVTRALRVSAAQVYLAKHRVGRVMKRAIRELARELE